MFLKQKQLAGIRPASHLACEAAPQSLNCYGPRILGKSTEIFIVAKSESVIPSMASALVGKKKSVHMYQDHSPQAR
jgi:hypothetical protein